MLLVVTNRDDFTADWLILEVEKRGLEFARFNTDDYPGQTGFTWSPAGKKKLRLGTRDLDLGDVDAVWFRRPVAPRVGHDLTAGRASWAIQESREALRGLWRTLDARWINHPAANRAAGSKLEQLERAPRLGFAVPATLVTNEPAEAMEFVRNVRGAVCKPLHSGRIALEDAEVLYFTSEITDAEVLRELGPEPVILQELVEKEHDVRVTVIGTEAFGVRIESQEHRESRVDWRRLPGGSLHHAVVQLPPKVSDACIELVRSYGLGFGAIDLARTPSGQYVFFELNPNGQWAWIEQLTGLPLRSRLVDLLLGE